MKKTAFILPGLATIILRSDRWGGMPSRVSFLTSQFTEFRTSVRLPGYSVIASSEATAREPRTTSLGPFSVDSGVGAYAEATGARRVTATPRLSGPFSSSPGSYLIGFSAMFVSPQLRSLVFNSVTA